MHLVISRCCCEEGGTVALYEIRTLTTRGRTSLMATAEYADDFDAILAARDFMRMGETIEVWREEALIYRIAPRAERDKLRAQTKKRSWSMRP